MTVLVANRLDGTGATTLNVAWTVVPLSTAGNDVADVAVADQPDGTCRPSLTPSAGSAPLSVNDSVAVAGLAARQVGSGR